MPKLTKEQFIERARSVHGDKYDYSKVEYVNNATKVCIICPEHGEYMMLPERHLRGIGCVKCARAKVWTYDSCYAEAKKYDSSSHFEKGNKGAFIAAKKNDWLKDYTWFKVLWQPRWDYDSCYSEAKNYTSRGDFKKGNPSAYTKARLQHWLDDYTWFRSKPKKMPTGYWTFETCYAEAKKYKTKKEFTEKCYGGAQAANRYGWMKEFSWFQPLTAFWTQEACFKEAQKYSFMKDFREGSPSAYNAAYDKGWLQDYTWLSLLKNTNGYWTIERCTEEAKKYKSKKEFLQGCAAAYTASAKLGLIKDFVWLRDDRLDIKGEIDSVYAYFFEESHSVYIGRTLMRRQSKRDKEHLFPDNNDAVAIHAQSLGVAVPPMTILEENLTLAEGLEREDFWRKFYEDDGYNILNRAATGVGIGSLGSIEQGKWNRDACYQEAQKYTLLRDFEKNSASAYEAARRNDWIKEYTWLHKLWHPKWDYDNCYKEAKKYSTRKDFHEKSGGAFNAAFRNGWLKEFTWLEFKEVKPSGYWNYEHCKKEAQKYSSRKAFQKGTPAAYHNAFINNWLDEWEWLNPKLKPSGYWNHNTCFEEAKKYTSRGTFQKKAVRAYQLSLENDWLKEYTWFTQPFVWTYELCKKEASRHAKRSHFKAASPGAYTKSRKNGWLDEFFPKK